MSHPQIHTNRLIRHFCLLLLCAALSLQACKKDVEVINGSAEPVFKVAYRVLGLTDTINLQAGVENIFHFTGYRYTQEYMYCTGAFAQPSCPAADCPGGLRFEIRNRNFGQVVETTMFDPGTLPYYQKDIDGNAIIVWIDPQGREWRSDLRKQESISYFRIVRSEAYDNNEKGNKTWKMDVEFSCALYLETGGEVAFKGNGTLAVAYP